MHFLRRPRALAAVATLLVLGTAQAALGHAYITPGRVNPGERVTLTIESVVERAALINTEMQVVVPRQWKSISCAGPVTWSCRLDAKAYKPHTLVVFTPVLPATPLDIRFSITVEAPAKAVGFYLFRTLQKHADGWVEPWVYDKEPYPAPRVQVGAGTAVINPEGSREDPRCFGPKVRPKDYDSHDGTGYDKGCSGATTPLPFGQRARVPAPVLLVTAAR
ncbi:MAG TPA: hypothetical protein VNB94_09300 [Mycobacteriales bacterium]|nr:hypothetical protein [Mycobacteriales bacterium]